MEGEALMPVEPGAHFRVFVSTVVVENDVDGLAGRHFGVDGIEEANERLVAVPLHVAAEKVPSRTLRAANRVVVPLRL